MALEICPPGKAPVTVQTVSEGEILGWAWLVPPYRWHLDAHAIELTRAIALDGQCLRKKCEEDNKGHFWVRERESCMYGETFTYCKHCNTDYYNRSYMH